MEHLAPISRQNRNAPLKKTAARQRPHWVLPTMSLALGSAGLVFTLGLVPVVTFPQEQIDVTIHQKCVEVSATYRYVNPWPISVTQGFGFPLPVDEQHPPPCPVLLTNANTEHPIRLVTLANQTGFELAFAPYQVIDVHLYYRQETPTQTARYILTTTGPWLQALRIGRYSLRAEGVSSISSNYHLVPSGTNQWIWERHNFMPGRDWEIAWQ